MKSIIDQQYELEALASRTEDQIPSFRRAYSKLCNAISDCLDEEEKYAVNGMYLFLHLDFPEDSNLHIDMVRNIPSSTDIGQHTRFKKTLTAAEIDLELDLLCRNEEKRLKKAISKDMPYHIE